MTRKTKAAIAICAVVLTLAVTSLVWKTFSAPQLEDSDFFVGEKSPPNLAVIRPTHFTQLDQDIETTSFISNDGKETTYWVGRDVSLQEMVVDAYGLTTEARIIFPQNLPTNKFDYLVTTSDKPEEHLQKTIKKKFGYIAHWETRNIDVLALKVETPDAPGLQVSTNTHNGYKHWRLIHHKIGVLNRTLENYFKQPVLDETSLTNFYDFNWRFAPWGVAPTNEAEINGSLENLGLGLESTNEPVQMLIVEKVR